MGIGVLKGLEADGGRGLLNGFEVEGVLGLILGGAVGVSVAEVRFSPVQRRFSQTLNQTLGPVQGILRTSNLNLTEPDFRSSSGSPTVRT